MNAPSRQWIRIVGALCASAALTSSSSAFADDDAAQSVASESSALLISLGRGTTLRSSRLGCVGDDVAAFPTASHVSFGKTTVLRHDYIQDGSYVRERWTPSGMMARWVTPLMRLTANSDNRSAPQVFATKSDSDRPRRLYVVASAAEDAPEQHLVVRKREAGTYRWVSSCGLLEVPVPAHGPFQSTFLIHGTRMLPDAPQDGEESHEVPRVPRSLPMLAIVGRSHGGLHPPDAPFVLLRSFDPEGDATSDQR